MYSRIPGIPVYSQQRAPREAVEPRGPFLAWRGVPVVVYPGGHALYPPGYAPWAYPGVYRGMPTGYTTPGTPRPATERASGLNRPRGVRVAGCQGRHAPLAFSYLRSFWPGAQMPLRASGVIVG